MWRVQKNKYIYAACLIICLAFCLSACTSSAENGTDTKAYVTLTEPTATVTESPAEQSEPTVTVTENPATQPDPEATEIDYERFAKSVVRLEVYNDRDDKIATGSGFAAFDGSILVTARHVVVNMDYMTATRDDGTTFRIDRVIDDDEKSDIVICALPTDAQLEPLELKEELPARGSEAVVISSQFGLINLVTKGDVCGIWKTDNLSMLVFSAPVSGGSSGAPLFDSEGLVTGIVTGTYDKGQNLNIAAPARSALTLYNNQ